MDRTYQKIHNLLRAPAASTKTTALPVSLAVLTALAPNAFSLSLIGEGNEKNQKQKGEIWALQVAPDDLANCPKCNGELKCVTKISTCRNMLWIRHILLKFTRSNEAWNAKHPLAFPLSLQSCLFCKEIFVVLPDGKVRMLTQCLFFPKRKKRHRT